MEDITEVKNRHVSCMPSPRTKGEIMKAKLTFRSLTTRKVCTLDMRYDWALKDYIRQLKMDGMLSKDEGTYNYNGQDFLINGKFHHGDSVLSYQEVCLLASEERVIAFNFR